MKNKKYGTIIVIKNKEVQYENKNNIRMDIN